MSSAAQPLDKDALDTLTPEERAAVEGHDFTADEVASLGKIAADGDDDDEEPYEDGLTLDADGKPVAVVVPAIVPATTLAADKPVAVVADPDPAPARATYDANLPADYDAQVAALKTKTDDLVRSFKAGEIDFDEYQVQNNALAPERERLMELRVEVNVSKGMTAQEGKRVWEAEVAGMIKTAKSEGVDYQGDPKLGADFDRALKLLAADPDTADKSMQWFLTEAHAMVKAKHGIAVAKPAAIDPAARRKPALGLVPKTLAHVPGGDGPGDVGSEFAALDALEGEDLEMAIGRMTPVQRVKFARGG